MLNRERTAQLIASAGGALILACTSQSGNTVNNELEQSLISKPALNDCELAKFSRSLPVKEREIGINRKIRQLFKRLFTPSFLDEFKIDNLVTENENLEYFISDAIKTISQRSLDCVTTIPSRSIAQPRIEFGLLGEPPLRIDSLIRVDLRGDQIIGYGFNIARPYKISISNDNRVALIQAAAETFNDINQEVALNSSKPTVCCDGLAFSFNGLDHNLRNSAISTVNNTLHLSIYGSIGISRNPSKLT